MGLFGREIKNSGPRPTPGQVGTAPGPAPSLTTTVAEGSKVSGDIGGSADVRIEGQFEGSITISGLAFISLSGHARASVRAMNVTVSGMVDGDVSADELIELQSTATVNGNLLAPKILIREGASLQGRVEMAAPPQKTVGPPPQNLSGKKKRGNRRSQGNLSSQAHHQSSGSGTSGEQE